jgi:site-specific DNA recombinase
MDIALYVRVSTNHQQQTQTIEQQIERLQAHVAGHPDWHLSEEHIYRDDGYSGAKLDRPGLDRLRDHAALADFEQVLITAPDRLARNYVHQVLLIDELTKVGCQVSFLERPMSDDPHDQLLLQIRGAVAEYERTLIADRMRRGRQAKMRSGRLLPWTVPPYGYLLDPERPRDPSRVRLDVVKGEVVKQIFEWYTDPVQSGTLYAIAKQLSDTQVPTPAGGRCWSVSSVRSILRNSSYAGIAYSGRSRPAAARHRKSALLPVGPGFSHTSTPPEEWIPIQVPALVSQETFDAVQARLDWNKQMARRNNDTHEYLLRGLVSCAQCRLACPARTLPSGYSYYVCRGHTDVLRAVEGKRCTARYAPAQGLDDLVWQDMCCLLAQPALIIHELEHGQGGAWLPQALQDRRRTLRAALAQLERQQARLLEVYLAEIIKRDEFERKRQELMHTQTGLSQQLRQLEAQAQKQIEVTGLAAGITAFCQRLQPTLDHLTFAQRRKLVELLIDRVIVDDDTVEIRYVIPTSPEGEESPFCHLRLDHFDDLPSVVACEPGRQIGGHWVVAKVKQDTGLARLAGVEAFQSNIQWVRTPFEGHVAPRNHFGIVTHTGPGRIVADVAGQEAGNLMAVRLGVDLVAHLDEHSDVVVGSESSIQAELSSHRRGIGGVVLFEARETLLQVGKLAVLLGQAGLCLAQAFFTMLTGLFPPLAAPLRRLPALTSLRQASSRALWVLADLVALFQLCQHLTAFLDLLSCLLQASQRHSEGCLLGVQPLLCHAHLCVASLDALPQQLGPALRASSGARFCRQHECFGLGARYCVAGVMGDREPQATVCWADHADQSSLIAQSDLIIHVTKGSVGVGLARIGDRQAGQVAIQTEALAVGPQALQVSVDKRLADLLEDLNQGVNIFPGEGAQGAAHTRVVCPSGLAPRCGDRLILVERVGSQADLLQLLEPTQGRDQELQDFGLPRVVIALLVQGNRLDVLNQANLLGKAAPGDQEGMLGVLDVRCFVVHRHSLSVTGMAEAYRVPIQLVRYANLSIQGRFR